LTWRATVNGLDWDAIPQSYAIEVAKRQAAIVRLGPDEALCTLLAPNGEAYARWTFDRGHLNNTKARIIRYPGLTE
jgi:hypothetical protein